jgi:DNA-binding HxlR family transcriptional regulator
MGLGRPTVPYADALRVLWRIRPRLNKRTGRLAVADTAKARSARVILSRSIRRLEARGLVRRTSRSHYALTDAGRALTEAFRSDSARDVASGSTNGAGSR